jgi:hypothetical protein
MISSFSHIPQRFSLLSVYFSSRHPNASHASLMSFKSRYSIAPAKQNHWEKDRSSIVGGKAGGVSRCFSLFAFFGVLESFLSLSQIGSWFLCFFKHSKNFGGVPTALPLEPFWHMKERRRPTKLYSPTCTAPAQSSLMSGGCLHLLWPFSVHLSFRLDFPLLWRCK